MLAVNNIGDYVIAHRIRSQIVASLQVIKRYIAKILNESNYSKRAMKILLLICTAFLFFAFFLYFAMNQYLEYAWRAYFGAGATLSYIIFINMALNISVLPLAWTAARLSVKLLTLRSVLRLSLEFNFIMFLATSVSVVLYSNSHIEYIPLVQAFVLAAHSFRILVSAKKAIL
jgi:hypothetical protein